MLLDKEKLESPFRKLRKSLKENPDQPTPEQVHKLRTNTRRVEAITHALSLDQRCDDRATLDAISVIRKKAGKVRDMDVLTGFASTLSCNDDKESLIQLLEHLGSERSRLAGKLKTVICKEGRKARLSLKEHLESIQDHYASTQKRSANDDEWPIHATAVALELLEVISAWPKLNPENLHAFRLKVKELRYVLQLDDSQDAEFIASLGQVKDAIGEWHDWSELAFFAAGIFEQNRPELVQKIRGVAAKKLRLAIQIANKTRRNYLERPDARAGYRKPPASSKKPAIGVTSKLVA